MYSPEKYNTCDIKSFIEKCERLNKTPYLDTPNFALKKDIELLEQIVGETGVKIVANNYYALKLKAEKVIGGGLNVYNSFAANFYGLPIIAAENGVLNQTDFPVMTLRHCPMKSHLKADCKNCPFESGYTYQMESGQEFNLSRKKLSTCTFYLKRK